jgi:hypothetical protein
MMPGSQWSARVFARQRSYTKDTSTSWSDTTKVTVTSDADGVVEDATIRWWARDMPTRLNQQVQVAAAGLFGRFVGFDES